MMLLIGGREPISYTDNLKANLAGFASQLLHAGRITGCLAVLPRNEEARRWLLSFLASLKRAGGGRVSVLLRASAFSEADLIEAAKSDLDEAVIFQGREDPEATIELLLRYLETRPSKTLGLRVWLDPDAGGHLQRTARVWEQAVPRLLGVELSPFSWENLSNGSAAMPNNGAQPLRCEWLNSAITIDCSGSLVPCPQHDPQEGLSLAANSNARLIAQMASWPETLGSHPVCRSCHRLPRFSVPAWMKTENGRITQPALRETIVRYEDHVRCNIESVSEGERESLLADFLRRASAAKDVVDTENPA